MAMSDFFKWFSRKESPSRRMIAMQRLGQPVSTPRNYEGFSVEGYQKNVVAFRAISSIAKNCGEIQWLLYSKRKGGTAVEIDNHEILDLLARPNPMQGQSSFIERLVSFLLISGNSYIEANGPTPGAKPTELWVNRPDRMTVVPGSTGLPSGYEYRVGGRKFTYEVDAVKGKSPILHWKTFHPVDDWYGMSPIESASFSIDQHNESGKWNLSLLQNKAAPSGALVVGVSEKNPSGRLDDDQYERLDRKLSEKYQGAQNAGRPMLLEGGLDWRQMGFSPQDMDWINGKNTAARDIANAFGFPPMLLGIPGDNTYSNQKEARLALYEETILPLMNNLRDELNNWLTPAFGDDLKLDYDRDKIEALAPKREALWSKIQTTEFLTINEKREAVGYEPVEGGDSLYVQATQIPLALANDISEPSGEEPEETIEDDPIDEDEGKSIEYKASENSFFDFVQRFIDRYVGSKITQIQETSRKRVVKAVRDAQTEHLKDGTTLDEFTKGIQQKVGAVYDSFSKSRARLIARTETAIAANEGSRAAAKSLGIPNLKKEWISADDPRTRDSDDATNHRSMNGVMVDINEKFIVPSKDGPDQMDGPGDPSAPVDQLANCRCVLTYSDSQDGKSFNLQSRTAKRRMWLKAIRQRDAFERKFGSQLSAVFRKEAREILDALEGIQDAKLAEFAIQSVLEESQKDMERVFRGNIEAITKRFGQDVLKLKA